MPLLSNDSVRPARSAFLQHVFAPRPAPYVPVRICAPPRTFSHSQKEASCLLRGDLLTLQALGVIQNPISPSFPYDDPRGALPVPQYFALLRAICISLHPLQVSDYQTFLPPALYDELSHRQMASQRDHVPPLQVAATHWIFEDWPTHFFAFLDALEHWSRENRKKHAFVWFPDRFLLGVKAPEATALLAGASASTRPVPSVPT